MDDTEATPIDADSARQIAEPTRVEVDGDYWFVCCRHCGCKPTEDFGHDGTCAEGCNDDEMSWL